MRVDAATGSEVCQWLLCWVPVDRSSYAKIFGFAEFLAALALLAVLFTISDVRYKFRTAIVPGHLYRTTFGTMLLVGTQALATEVWIAQGWYVPHVAGLTSTTWQAMFGLIFLGTFGTWMYFAYIRPPIFDRRNAERYANTLFVMLVKANDEELKVLASEVGRSAQSIISNAGEAAAASRRIGSAPNSKHIPKHQGYAVDLLYLIASRSFCRHIVASSPVTIIQFLDAASQSNTKRVPIGEFAQSVSIEAFANKNSFVFYEDRHYDSGLIGHLKPVTQALYGRYSLIEAMEKEGVSSFNLPFDAQQQWDGTQWEAYCRLALLFFEDYVKATSARSRSQALREVLRNVSLAHAFGEYEGEQYHRLMEFRRLSASVNFVKRAIALLDEHGAPPDQPRPKKSYTRESIYDDLAHLMFDACKHVARVKRKDFASWAIQYGCVWSEFFSFDDTATWRIVRRRFCHLVAEEVCHVATRAHFGNVALLGFCANVMGLNMEKRGSATSYHDTRGLHRLVLRLIREHYPRLLAESTRLADALLVGKLSFDPRSRTIVKTYEMGLSDVAPTESLAIGGSDTRRTVRRLRSKDVDR